jgi:DNA-directed RNA polymerase subunit RPC12/RpoP
MATPRKGVTCSHCGASTPLPDDLRTPRFECQYCHTVLETVAYAGLGAVRAEEMRAVLDGIARGEVPTSTPQRLVHGGDGTRDLPCVHCKATLAVPLHIETSTVTCAACGRVEPVNRYISDAERLEIDMQRQIAGNAAVAELVRNGIPCDRCGAPNQVPEPIPVQVVCSACSHAILLSGHVPADAVDRARLKHSALALRDAIQVKAKTANRTNSYVAIGMISVILVIAIVATLATR